MRFERHQTDLKADWADPSGFPLVGVDFTSAPSKKKPITWVTARREDARLWVQRCERFSDWPAFETKLSQEGPWLGAFDFPFGQAEAWLRQMGWPLAWADYVQKIAEMGKAKFEQAIHDFVVKAAPGQKLYFRPTDRATQSSSPMKLFYPPVGKMFFQGAPRLLQAGVSVWPCHPLGETESRGRLAMEGYPAQVVRMLQQSFGLPKASYKTETPAKDSPERQAIRKGILSEIQNPELAALYGVFVVFDPEQWPETRIHETFLAPCDADGLDALLCCLQAAWAQGQGIERQYGVPDGVNPDEGWIIDPGVCLPGAQGKN